MKCGMDPLDIMSYTLAAAAHDVKHPGVNNAFLVEKRDYLANIYHEDAVLESHSIATLFSILHQSQFDLFSSLDNAQYKKVRKIIIGAILATDMARHFDKLGRFK